jgi:hypothetical protein
MLGSGDIQSLADFGASFERLNGVRNPAFDKGTALAFALSAAIPMAPLVLTVMPLSENPPARPGRPAVDAIRARSPAGCFHGRRASVHHGNGQTVSASLINSFAC